MLICLERGADLHMAQLMPLSLTVSCFSKIQIGSTFLVPAHPGSPGQTAIKLVCVCVFVCYRLQQQHAAGLLLSTQGSRCRSIAARRACSTVGLHVKHC